MKSIMHFEVSFDVVVRPTDYNSFKEMQKAQEKLTTYDLEGSISTSKPI